VAVAAVALPRAAAAQEPDSPLPPPDTTVDCGSLFERLNLDRLRLGAFGAYVGAVKPAQARATSLYSLSADYGEISPRLHLVFTATYWGSRFSNEAIGRFERQLREQIVDTTGDYELTVGRVTISDIALGADFRWFPRPNATLRPYVGGGFAAHVINAEGRIISGTFVVRALDNITAGVAGLAGADLYLLPSFNVGVQARVDLLSGSRFAAVRLGGSYVFEQRTGRRR
jgi:hypothetical protein